VFPNIFLGVETRRQPLLQETSTGRDIREKRKSKGDEKGWGSTKKCRHRPLARGTRSLNLVEKNRDFNCFFVERGSAREREVRGEKRLRKRPRFWGSRTAAWSLGGAKGQQVHERGQEIAIASKKGAAYGDREGRRTMEEIKRSQPGPL